MSDVRYDVLFRAANKYLWQSILTDRVYHIAITRVKRVEKIS